MARSNRFRAIVLRKDVRNLNLNPSTVMSCTHVVRVKEGEPARINKLRGLVHSDERIGRFDLLVGEFCGSDPDFQMVSRSRNPVSYQSITIPRSKKGR